MRLRTLKEPAPIGNAVQRVGQEQAIERAEGPGERREIADVRPELSRRICEALMSRPEYQRARTVAIFDAMPETPESRRLPLPKGSSKE